MMTSEPTETELKLELDPDGVEALMAAPLLTGCAMERSDLVSRYYDTPDGLLRKAGYALRIRRDGDRHIQTLKAEGMATAGLFVRPEWECETRGEALRTDAAAGPLEALLSADALATLAPRFETRISRTRFELTFEGARIEGAIDVGEVVDEDQRESVHELELELREGAPRALFDVARALDDRVPLRLGVRSKSERGFAIAGPKRPRCFKAEPLTLDREGDARAAFAAIAQSCIRQFRLNEPLVMTTGAPAPLHQARVGLRRLRSAFALFKPLFADDPQADVLRLALKALAADLGEVRNLDVLIPRIDGSARTTLEAARSVALEHVRAVLASARTRLLMVDLAEWLALGDWRTEPADCELATMPAATVAASILDDHRRRIKKRGRDLAALDDEARHRVRIEAKKLRYAAEFFGSLFPHKKQRRRHEAFLAAIETLQDLLGELNDIATGREVLAAHGIAVELPLRAKGGKLRDHAEDALDRLLDVKRFWR